MIMINIVIFLRSATYSSTFRTCKLSEEDRRTAPASFRPAQRGTDYLENECADCEWMMMIAIDRVLVMVGCDVGDAVWVEGMNRCNLHSLMCSMIYHHNQSHQTQVLDEAQHIS